MNKQIHRLVFDRNRGMRVPAAEHVRSAGKAGGGETRAVAVACALTLAGLAASSAAAPPTRSLGAVLPRAANVARSNPGSNLPVLSTAAQRTAGNRGNYAVSNPDGRHLLVNQLSSSIVVNWDSFNIGRDRSADGSDYSVHFEQPKDGTALNKIWDANPTVIFGKLTATGTVVLENTNGVIFGPTARVETQRFVATALAMAKDTLPDPKDPANGKDPVFGSDNADSKGFISVERGAEIKALAGGHVMLIGPRVYNEGRIETPGGQAILAAGKKVYLFNSQDANQQGLMVAVDPFTDAPQEGINTVENAVAQQPLQEDGTADLSKQINEIVAEHGTINLVGLTVRQNGLLTATSAVADGKGGIFLQAQKATRFDEATQRRVVTELGAVELGATGQTRALQSDEQRAALDEKLVKPLAELASLNEDFSVAQSAWLAAKQRKAEVEATLLQLKQPPTPEAPAPADLPQQIAQAELDLGKAVSDIATAKAKGDQLRILIEAQRSQIAQIGLQADKHIVVDIQGKTITNERLSAGAPVGGEVLWARYDIDNPDWFNPVASALFRAISAQDGTQVVVKQTQDRAIFNWDSFNIGAGMSVVFEQPKAASVLNRIDGQQASTVAGGLSANSELIVENTAGLTLQGQVDAGRFVATALKLDDVAFGKGFRGDNGATVLFGGDTASDKGFVSVQAGASIKTHVVEGHQSDVLILGPQVSNAGTISTPDGQTVLAAGKKVSMVNSTDPSARGLNVLTDAFEPDPNSMADRPAGTNTVRNAGTVTADRGTITLAGAAIRQDGTLKATTSVKGKNGFISLQASRQAFQLEPSAPRQLGTLGSVEFGANSVTAITADTDKSATQKDADKYYRSHIDVIGKDVRVRGGAQLVARSGDINLLALADSGVASGQVSNILLPVSSTSAVADDSHLVVDKGAVIDVSGMRDVAVDMGRNQLSNRLFKIELADSPVQRGGVLYRSTVAIDARNAVSVADVTGFYNAIERSAEELSTTGGHVRMESQGAVVVADGAKVDISGGSIRYLDGVLTNSFLRQGQRLVRLSDAVVGERYDELITGSGGSAVQPGYAEGFDAGSVVVAGMGKTVAGLSGFKAGVVVGPRQRNGRTTAMTDAEKAQYLKLFGSDPLVYDDEVAEGTGRHTYVGRPSVLKLSPNLYGSFKPQAGLVTIGKTYGQNQDVHYVDKVNLVQKRSQAVGAVPELDDTAALARYLGALPAQTEVVVGDIAQTGLGQLWLNANQVHMDRDAVLDLGSGGELTVNANSDVTLAGAFKAEGGKFTANVLTGDFHLESSARIDLSGRELDESGTAGGGDALSVNGGSFTVNAGHSATLSAGSEVDVSAGVWRTSTGSTVKGIAGTVDVAMNRFDPNKTGQLVLDGDLAAFDFSKGGTLKLANMRTLDIGGAAFNGGLALDTGFFSAHGFGTFSLSALGDVRVAEGARLTPVLTNLALAVGGREGMTERVVLDPSARQSSKLTLTASLQPKAPADLPIEGLDEGGTIAIGATSLVDVGIGGELNLKAGANMVVAGRLQARGGTVSLGLSGFRGDVVEGGFSQDKVGYLPGQSILLKDGAVIDVSGAAKTTWVNGRLIGDVLGGGTVNLNVSPGNAAPVRGRVVTEVGSEIKVDGAFANLNLGRSARTTRISKGAGSINVGATDGFLLQGSMSADRPDAGVAAGQFSASVSREGIPSYTAADNKYPEKSGADTDASIQREIIVEATVAQLKQHEQDGYAKGVVSAKQLADAGFDRIQLRADDRIVLGEGANLKSAPGKAPLRSVVLNSPVLMGMGAGAAGTHTVQASHVALGDRDLKAPVGANAAFKPTASSGDASLLIYAGLIEVMGHSALQGIGQTTLAATMGGADNQPGTRRDGEIRFIGRTFKDDTRIEGSFQFDGDLTLQAGQVYASTLSDFDVTGAVGTSSLTVSGPSGGSTSQAPLSALADLTLHAHDVRIDGVVRQPFGTIRIEGETKPVLGPASLLSVSGDGVTVPVGSTVNQTQWVYDTKDDDSVGSTDTVRQLDGLPVGKGVTISGYSLDIDGRSQLHAQAGGDLLAGEFVAGAGGSSNTLDRPNVFAILPNYSYDFAPFDTEINTKTKANGTSLMAGDKVDITAGVTVKTGPNTSVTVQAGSYTLLPAGYAVLPGAVLVSTTPLATGTSLTKAMVQDDLSVLTTGYKTAVGTTINGGMDARVALLLETEATYRAKSELQSTSINEFLAAQAKKKGTAVPSRPGDAGRVSLDASGEAFNWSAVYDLSGKEGFASGQFDLAMPGNMALVKQGEAAPAGFNAVTAEALNATGASSILLGGIREGTAEAPTVKTTSSDQVRLAADFTGGELIVVARKQVDVRDGVSLVSNAAQSDLAHQLTLDGDGAALVVSNRLNTDLHRTLSNQDGADPGGVLKIGKGVKIKGVAAQLDASQSVDIDPGAAIDVLSLGLGSHRIAVGGASDNADALVLDGALLDSKQRLQLRSYSSIDLVGSLSLGKSNADGTPLLQRLTLDAPLVRGVGGSNDVASLLAQQVVLRNGSGVAPVLGEASKTALSIMAKPPVKDSTAEGITLGGGEQTLAFRSTQLSTTGDIIARADGEHAATLHTQGDAVLKASRITAGGATKQGIVSGGVLTIAQAVAADKNGPNDSARSLNDRVGAGAKLSLTGQRVLQNGTIDLASGQIDITGSGQAGQTDTVVFAKDSRTLATGWVAQAGSTWQTTAPGGKINVLAQQGNIQLDGLLDVSVPMQLTQNSKDTPAGGITLKAPDGKAIVGANARLQGSAATPGLSGMFNADLGHVVQANDTTLAAANANKGLDALVKLSQDGGFHRELEVRIREGNATLNESMAAARVIMSADKGAMTLGTSAKIDARAERGGVVQLSARDDVVLQTGAKVLADASADPAVGANGGDILLASSVGKIKLESGVTVSAKGDDAEDGRVVLRAKRDSTTAFGVERVQIADVGDIAAGETVIEAVQTYEHLTELVSGLGNTQTGGTRIGQDKLKADTQAFMANKTGILAALGLTGKGVHLRSGVELRADGDFTVANDWNLWEATRAGGEPISLTVRAKGDLNINGSLSDGFATATRAPDTATAPTEIKSGLAASFRLVAGADQNAANVLAVAPVSPTAPGKGSLTIADGIKNSLKDGGKMVRTTSGSIDLVAATDIKLVKDSARPADVQGVAYVAGRPSANPVNLAVAASSLPKWLQFTEHGQRLSAQAGRDIVSPLPSQLFGNWFYHTGQTAASVAWGTSFDSLKQGLVSAGGGDVRVTAGRDIVNLGVAVPTSARTVRDADGGLGQLTQNGGNMLVRADGDIAGGVYLLSKGTGRIEADGMIGPGSGGLGIILGLMDGQWAVQAGGDVTLGLVYNPTMLDSRTKKATAQRILDKDSGAYLTYSDAAAVTLASTRGDVLWQADSVDGALLEELHNKSSPDGEDLNWITRSQNSIVNVAPGTMNLNAFTGDVKVTWKNNLYLAPTETGNLDVYAGRDLLFTGENPKLIMLDTDIKSWSGWSLTKPGANSPVAVLAGILSGGKLDDTNPSIKMLHENDGQAAHIHAQGDMTFGSLAGLVIPKAVDITAGGDIQNIDLVGQNLRASDITRIAAGGDLIGASNVDVNGIRTAGKIQIGGPGELQIEAGHDFNLSTSYGIETVGNRVNPGLPSGGASIKVSAGMDKKVDVDEFAGRYLASDGQAQGALIDFVQTRMALSGLSYEQALGYYRGMTPAHQTEFAVGRVSSAFVATYVAPRQSSLLLDYAAYKQAALAQNLAGDFTPADAVESGALLAFVKDKLLTRGWSADEVKDMTAEQALKRYKGETLPGHRAITSADQVEFLSDQILLPRFVATAASKDPAQLADVVSKDLGARQTLAMGDFVSWAWSADASVRDAVLGFVKSKKGQAAGLDQAAALDIFRKMPVADQQQFASGAGLASFASAYLQSAGYAQAWAEAAKAAGITDNAAQYTSARFAQFKDDVLMKELQRLGANVSSIALSSNDTENAKRIAARQVVWDLMKDTVGVAGLGEGFDFAGDLSLAGSQIQTHGLGDKHTGGIDLFAPGGQVLVGLLKSTKIDREQGATRGLITNQGGSIRSFSDGDFQVNSQKLFVVGSGDVMLYSANGDIDSGRGSNTDVASVSVDIEQEPFFGDRVFKSRPPVTGSGIGIVRDGQGEADGKVSLLTPNGEVKALDAYIQGPGKIDIPGPVVGGDNLKGAVTGQAAPPPVTVNLGINKGLATETAAGESVAADAAQRGKAKERGSLLTVELLGLGETDAAPGAGEKACDSKKDKDCAKP